MRAELTAEQAEAAHDARRLPSSGVTVHVAEQAEVAHDARRLPSGGVTVHVAEQAEAAHDARRLLSGGVTELAAEQAETAHDARRLSSGGVTVHVAVGGAGGGDGSGGAAGAVSTTRSRRRRSRTFSFDFKKAEVLLLKTKDEQANCTAARRASKAASASSGNVHDANDKAMALTESKAPEGTIYVSDDINAPLSRVGPRVTNPEDAVSSTVAEGDEEAAAEKERAANAAAGTILAANQGNSGGGGGATAMFAELRARRSGRDGGMTRPTAAGSGARALFANRDARARWLAATAALTKDATERTGALRARLVCAQAARSALARFVCEPDGARTSARVLGQARARAPPPQPLLPPDSPHTLSWCTVTLPCDVADDEGEGAMPTRERERACLVDP